LGRAIYSSEYTRPSDGDLYIRGEVYTCSVYTRTTLCWRDLGRRKFAIIDPTKNQLALS